MAKHLMVEVELLEDIYPNKKGDVIEMKAVVTQSDEFINKVKILGDSKKAIKNAKSVTKAQDKGTALEDYKAPENTEQILPKDGGVALFKRWLEGRTDEQVEQILAIIEKGKFQFPPHCDIEACQPVLDEWLEALKLAYDQADLDDEENDDNADKKENDAEKEKTEEVKQKNTEALSAVKNMLMGKGGTQNKAMSSQDVK